MTLPTTLDDWLAILRQQHHKVHGPVAGAHARAARPPGHRFEVPVIVVAGTNGKGSTCAMLESIARQAGYRVGLYRSRTWCTSRSAAASTATPVDGRALLPHFEAVEAARGGLHADLVRIHHLAIARRCRRPPLDLVILEVGWAGASTRSTPSTPTARSSPASTSTTWSTWAPTARRSAWKRRT
jgi:dihydrofolate synthase/folylpolyglutamate synthase